MRVKRQGNPIDWKKSAFHCAFLLLCFATVLNLRGFASVDFTYKLMEYASTEVLSPSIRSSNSNTAYKQSFGLLNDIPNEEWEKIRRKVHTQSIYQNPENPLLRVHETEYWLQNNLNPNFDCNKKEQIGGQNLEDGVKFVCNPDRLTTHKTDEGDEEKGCLVYSIGCAGNYVFEDGLSERLKNKCEIHVFDPARKWARRGDPETKNIHYHAWGFVRSLDRQAKSRVWPAGVGGEFKTFQETIEALGHKNRTIDLFKIDCEGCEYSTYKDWIGHDIRQILVEIHGVPTPDGPPGFWYSENMDVSEYYGEYQKNGFALYHSHPYQKGVELGYIRLDQDFWRPLDA